MAKSIREQIIDALRTRAATILTAGGYNINMGANVQWAGNSIDPEDLPAVVVWPRMETVTREYGDTLAVMPVRIEALALIGSGTPGQLVEQMLADLISAFDGGAAISSYIEDCKYTGGGAEEYPEAGAQAVAVMIELEITYRTAAGNPYSQ